MRILNLGSLNIDKVYNVEHFVRAGETILADNYDTFCGGKGLNQSIALARAGANVYHAGAVGKDGDKLCSLLTEAGVKTDYLQKLDTISGHAIIQLTPQGQNCIMVYAGANSDVSTEYIDKVISEFDPGDILLLQNEISNVSYAMKKASEAGLKIAFNPSPITDELMKYPLELVDYFILNEVEGNALAKGENNEEILAALYARFPKAAIVLTIGKQGVLYKDNKCKAHHGIYDVPVVDTTAAGDTFSGYFIACIANSISPEKALEYASKASSLAVGKKGAANSIPTWKEVEQCAL